MSPERIAAKRGKTGSRFPGIRRVVVKLGSGTVTDPEKGLREPTIRALAAQLSSAWTESGVSFVVVTSGAIAAGRKKLGMTERPRTVALKQAAAAVGQTSLMRAYERAFEKRGRHVAQLLLTHEDFENRERYVNARNTLLTLLSRGIVPIVNENDTVATEEIRLEGAGGSERPPGDAGDPDDRGGPADPAHRQRRALHEGSPPAPRRPPHPDRAGHRRRDDPCRRRPAHLRGGHRRDGVEDPRGAGPVGVRGTGRHRLGAFPEVGPRRARREGHRDAHPAAGRREAFEPEDVDRVRPPLPRDRSRGRRRAEGAAGGREEPPARGSDRRRRDGSARGTSVSIADRRGRVFARGIARWDSEQVDRGKGKRSAEVRTLLGPETPAEVVHRDDLTILPQSGASESRKGAAPR